MAILPRLLFVRHGETAWNLEGRLQGQTDIPLNNLGRLQAEDVGRRLAKLIPDPSSLNWLVSPLKRTRDTAEIARRALGLDPSAYILEPRIVELTFGAWEGFTWGELRKNDPLVEIEREKQKWDFVPPSGESYAMLAKRLRPWLETVNQECVVVSHGGVARALMAMLAGVPEAEAPRHDIWQGRVLVFEGSSFRWH